MKAKSKKQKGKWKHRITPKKIRNLFLLSVFIH